jgi:hypothetical protein
MPTDMAVPKQQTTPIQHVCLLTSIPALNKEAPLVLSDPDEILAGWTHPNLEPDWQMLSTRQGGVASKSKSLLFQRFDQTQNASTCVAWKEVKTIHKALSKTCLPQQQMQRTKGVLPLESRCAQESTRVLMSHS